MPASAQNQSYIRQCLPNGAWSGQTPDCVRERCPDLTPPSDVIMNCSDENKIGSNCTFSCNQDSNLVGSRWRECTITGTWSNSKYHFPDFVSREAWQLDFSTSSSEFRAPIFFPFSSDARLQAVFSY